MTTIYIPAADIKKDSWQYMNLLLTSIKDGLLSNHYEIVVGFDGCSEEFVDRVYDKFSFVRFDKRFINLGSRKNFCGSVNKGLRILHGLEGKDVIVINQDCLLPPLEFFQRIEGKKTLTSATEVCMAQTWNQREDLYEMLTISQSEDSIWEQVNKIIGFCFYLPKEFMDEVGYLNEYLQASFDDDDLCARSTLKGWPIYKSNVLVQHFQNKLGAYNQVDLPIRKNQFNILWHIPLEIPHEKFQDFIKENHEWKEGYKEC